MLSRVPFHIGLPSLPPGRAVIIAGAVEGAVPGAAPEEPLHFVLVQVRLADVGIQLVVIVVPDAFLAIRRPWSPPLQ